MNKYLEKLAGVAQMKRVVKRHFLKNKNTYKFGAAGAAIGSTAGIPDHEYKLDPKTKNYNYKKLNSDDRIKNALKGAAMGAGIWAILVGRKADSTAAYIKASKRARARYQRESSSYGGYGGSGRSAGNERATSTIHDIHKDLQKPGGFRTKAEATAHFRKMRSQLHPDKHPPEKQQEMNSKMAKFNRAWDQFNRHPEGFEKLANAYLLKAAAIDLGKVKRLIRENPLPVIGGVALGGEAFMSTTKQKSESPVRYHLRQVRNTAGGVGAGVVTGKVIQEGYKHIKA